MTDGDCTRSSPRINASRHSAVRALVSLSVLHLRPPPAYPEGMAAPGWAKRAVAKHQAAVRTVVSRPAAAAPAPQQASAAPPQPPGAPASTRYVSDPRMMPVGTRLWKDEPASRPQHAQTERPRGLIAPLPESNMLVRPDPAFDAMHAARLASLPTITRVNDGGRIFDLLDGNSNGLDAMADEALRAAGSVQLGQTVVSDAKGNVLFRGALPGGGIVNRGGASPRAFPQGHGAPAAISGAQPLGTGIIPSVPADQK